MFLLKFVTSLFLFWQISNRSTVVGMQQCGEERTPEDTSRLPLKSTPSPQSPLLLELKHISHPPLASTSPPPLLSQTGNKNAMMLKLMSLSLSSSPSVSPRSFLSLTRSLWLMFMRGCCRFGCCLLIPGRSPRSPRWQTAVSRAAAPDSCRAAGPAD